MTTARDIITDALGDVGVLESVETMSGDQAAHGLRTLNRIVDAWRAKRLYIYAVSNVTANFSGSSAAVGSGLTINTDKPLRFERGCYYKVAGIDYQLPEWTREQYNSILLKTTQSQYPQGYYFDRNIPGTVFVWPVPSSSVEYHFQVMTKLSSFADLDTDYSLPDGYYNALFYTMCERLPAAYNLPVNPGVPQEAAKARQSIRQSNTQVPMLVVRETNVARSNILTGDVL